MKRGRGGGGELGDVGKGFQPETSKFRCLHLPSHPLSPTAKFTSRLSCRYIPTYIRDIVYTLVGMPRHTHTHHPSKKRHQTQDEGGVHETRRRRAHRDYRVTRQATTSLRPAFQSGFSLEHRQGFFFSPPEVAQHTQTHISTTSTHI